MNKIIVCVGLVLWQLILCGCINTNSATKIAPNADSGDALVISEYIYGPKIRSSDILLFGLVNKSQECIVFSHDFGQRIFFQSDGIWHPIGDRSYYGNQNEIKLTVDNPDVIVSVAPDFSEFSGDLPTNFKVILTGKLCSNNNVVVEKTIPFTIVP